MSNFRRHLIASSIGGGGSWYRICEGGIYTATNAYINTGYKNFTNSNLKYWFDCKIISESSSFRGICGTWSDNYRAYNAISITQSTDIYPNVICGARTYSSDTAINNAKPYINKKVRVTAPYNQYGYYFSIQFYENEQLGTIIYSTRENNEWSTTSIPYPMMIFARDMDGLAKHFGNNIVIYKAFCENGGIVCYNFTACQLTQNISADLAWDNQPHYAGEYGMYDEVSSKFFGNTNSTGSFIENID